MCFYRLLFCPVLVSFQQVFDVQTKQDQVFDVVARPVIDKFATLLLCFAVVYWYLQCIEIVG